MWGALPFGVRFDRNQTSVEAYRKGMQAIREGAGEDSFLLGCNAPMWPSLGVVHGMRVTNDVARNFTSFVEISKQCFKRNWQHNRLWINDPDTLLLCNRDKTVPGPDGKTVLITNGISQNEFIYNATYILASGGMVLSGDDITEFTTQDEKYLKKLLPPSGVAAMFESDDCNIGHLSIKGEEIFCFFNKENETRNFQITLNHAGRVKNFWTEEDFGMWKQGTRMISVEGHSAAAYVIRRE